MSAAVEPVVRGAPPRAGGIAVIGLGNLLMSDDGVGMHVVRCLRERYVLPDAVQVVDGGTAGLGVLPFLADAQRAILIDAAELGREPGAIVELEPDDWGTVLAAKISPHDIGLPDLLGAAVLSGQRPAELELWCVQVESTRLGIEPTPAVAATIDALVERLAVRLADWGAPPTAAA